MPLLDASELAEILARRAARLSAARDVHVEREAIQTCLKLAGNAGGADPARSVTLLEAAAALALGSKPGRLGPDEIAAVESLSPVPN